MFATDSLRIQTSTGATSACFSAQYGGMMTSLIMQAPEGSRELLYFAPEFDFKHNTGMNGGAPFCFPICARLSRNAGSSRYLYEGKTYHMDIHGFAYQEAWTLRSHKEDTVVLALTANADTEQQYPFKFELVLAYAVQENTLICTQTYKNNDTKPMPYYAGFHPYLRLPFSKAEIFLQYQPLARLQYNAELTDIIGTLPLFASPTNLLLPELNESLVRLGGDKKVGLSFPDGSLLELEAKGVEDPDLFSYVQLYHRLDEPFLCIESWMSFPNAMNSVQGVRWLQPGQAEHGVFYLRLT